MPPPELVDTPPETVKPESATFVFAFETSNTLKKGELLPAVRWIVSRLAPGPLIARLLSINSSLARLIEPRTLGAKLIVLPTQALSTTERNDPAPESLLLFTTRLISLQTGRSFACTSKAPMSLPSPT